METILTQLQHSFAEWRASSKNRHANANLRAQAIKCLDHYSYQEVSAAIGMSVNSIRSWKKSCYREQEMIDHDPGFVAMSLDINGDIEMTNQAPLSLQIHLLSGTTIQVSPASIEASVMLIVALDKESRPCSI